MCSTKEESRDCLGPMWDESQAEIVGRISGRCGTLFRIPYYAEPSRRQADDFDAAVRCGRIGMHSCWSSSATTCLRRRSGATGSVNVHCIRACVHARACACAPSLCVGSNTNRGGGFRVGLVLGRWFHVWLFCVGLFANTL